jgi:hypothetical protein
MKKISFIILFLALLVSGSSQTDTLFTKAKKKIACKITEIGETEIRYKLPDNPDGPVYVISASKVYKYSLSGGKVVVITPDELLVENQYLEIMDRRRVVKVHPFSYVNNQIGVAYEQVLKMGTNLDLELGYINNGIMSTTASNPFRTSGGKYAPMTGFYLKPGVKFLLGQDFSLKGMKYAHPLKGRFILINAVASYLRYQDAYFIQSQQMTSGPSPVYPYQSSTTVTATGKKTDVNCAAYGIMINYGRQFILGNCITLEYYIGVGATGQSISYANSVSTTSTYVNGSYPSGYYYYNRTDQQNNVNNYHGFFRVPKVGLSYTLGFRMGFILPEKKQPAGQHGRPQSAGRE